MNKYKAYTPLLLWIISYQAVSFIMGQITQGNIETWYASLPKSSLTPHSLVFPIAWSILYVFLAYLGFLLFHQIKSTKKIKVLYLIQMLLNWLWTPIFFGLHCLGAALITLSLMVAINAYLTYNFWAISKGYGILSLLYQLWISFALYLNFYIWALA